MLDDDKSEVEYAIDISFRVDYSELGANTSFRYNINPDKAKEPEIMEVIAQLELAKHELIDTLDLKRGDMNG